LTQAVSELFPLFRGGIIAIRRAVRCASVFRDRRAIGNARMKTLDVQTAAPTRSVLTRIYFGGVDAERTIKLDSVRVIRSAESE
jgi:hypothetical protein